MWMWRNAIVYHMTVRASCAVASHPHQQDIIQTMNRVDNRRRYLTHSMHIQA